MAALPVMGEPAGNELSRAVLGFHDGLASWTLVLEDGQGAESQHLVALHERAHHHLHLSTPWGIATVLAGLIDQDGSQDKSGWRWLVTRCTRTHERFATWQAVTLAEDGLEILRGNFAYLDHVRWTNGLLAQLPIMDDSQRRSVVEHVFRYAMSPAVLVDLELTDILDLPGSSNTCNETNTPDTRIDHILHLLQSEPVRAKALVAAICDTTDADETWEAVCHALDGPGTGSVSAQTIRVWTEKVVNAHNARLDSSNETNRVVLLHPSDHADPLSRLVDLIQFERLRLHSNPLPLRTTGSSHGRPPIVDLVRKDTRIGPYVVLAWALPRFLRKHFTGVPIYDDVPRLGLLGVDRRPPDPRAIWADLTPASPALINAALEKTQVTTLRFMTLRSLEATHASEDFRGWSDTMILIDSDILVFLQHGTDAGERLAWWMYSVTGDRNLYVLVYQRISSPSETYFLPISHASRGIIVQWMRGRPQYFVQDQSAFRSIKDALLCLADLLIAILWQVDLRG